MDEFLISGLSTDFGIDALVYFISYFFIFIDDNRMKTITLDYTTTLISLIPTMMFLAAILFCYRLLNKVKGIRNARCCFSGYKSGS